MTDGWIVPAVVRRPEGALPAEKYTLPAESSASVAMPTDSGLTTLAPAFR